ncbi:MAG: amino acid adenylation domain-containing protein [Thermodesulfobacteriota bacterium]|nr:amino acid adenylation domain-containing protein [Thermodesulfobacteriota bacterium]
MLSKENLKDVYPLSLMQEGLLFHALHDAGSSAYFQQMSYRIFGNLDVRIFEQSLNELLKRHDVFRTVFVYKNVPRPLQFVLKNRKIDFHFEDIRALNGADQEASLSNYKETDKDRPFDLSKDMMMRISLFQLQDDSFEIIWAFHHILMDGWSLPIIQKEFFQIYSSLLAGARPELAPVTPFSEYIKWLEKRDKTASKQYWKNYLAGYDQLATLPRGTPAGISRKYRLETLSFDLDEELTSGLRELAAEHRVTLNTVIQTLWGILLVNYNDVDDVVFGATVSGRPPEIAGVEQMVGLFINTIPVRVQVAHGQSFGDLLKNVQQDASSGNKHCYHSLAEIQTHTPLKRGLFDHIMVFENYPLDEELDRASQTTSGLRIDRSHLFEHTHYDLELVLFPGKRIRFQFAYNGEVFDALQIRRIEGHLRRIIHQILNDATLSAKSIDILGVDEKEQLLFEFNDTGCPYPTGKSIAQIFEQQAAAHPDNTAILFEDRALSYKELNGRSNSVARYLKRDCGIGPDDLVGIMTDRSEWMIIGILGILKAGGAYVPIDPAFPQKRIDYILKKSACKTIVTEPKYIDAARASSSGQVINIHDISVEDRRNPVHTVSPNDLAYVIYTSGSTGDPKGVMITHKDVISFNVNMAKRFGLVPSDRILALATISFDISVLELLNSLMNGLSVVISPDSEVNEPGNVLHIIEAHGVSVLQVTPSRLNLLLEGRDPAALSSLRVLLIGGEPLSKDLFDRLRPLFSTVEVINVYGPTETTIWSTCKKLNHGELNIGSPLMNESVFILSRDMKLVPIGVTGEICIGGHGLARGYYNRPELTAEKFFTPPFSDAPIYRTGDLGRWLADGNIECLGRNDDQVKIRGYRVELGEIAHCLKNHPDIDDAVVVAKAVDPFTQELAAYLITSKKPGVSLLRPYLAERLPDYMVPSHFVRLEAFPFTPSGKIDKGALPDPVDLGLGPDTAYVAPRNDLEEKLAEIWRRVLRKDAVGMDDDFFELGGHSLKATRIVSAIHKELGIEIGLRDVFRSPTISGLSLMIAKKGAAPSSTIPRVPRKDHYALSHAQKRLWVLDQMEGGFVAYNMPGAHLIEGKLNLPALRKAFSALVERHESLRTTFATVAGEPRQIIHDAMAPLLQEIDLSRLSHPTEAAKDAAQKEAVAPFDLSVGPLLRAKLLKLADDRQVLLLNMHHIISDAWSLYVLSKDLLTLYAAYLEKRDAPLSPLANQYKDYAAWQNALLSSDKAKEHQAYWHQKLAGELPVLDLLTDYPRPPVQTYNGATLRFCLDESLTNRLATLGSKHHASAFMVLLSLVKVLLHRYTGQEDMVVGSPVTGRNRDDLEDQIGFYVNTLVLRDEIDGHDSFETILGKVKQTVLDAQEHQIYPFDRLVDELGLKKDLSRAPLFDVMVVLDHSGQNVPTAKGLRTNDFTIEPNISKFDLTFEFTDRGNTLHLGINFNTDLFRHETIQRLAKHFETLAKSALQDPSRPVKALNILDERERQLVLQGFNDTQVEYPSEQTIPGLFEAQVQKRPDHMAVIFDDRQLSYKELNAKADQVSQYLRMEHDIQPEEIIGLMLDRSHWSVIGLLGILKSGGAYLPIDPGYPEERIRYMLHDSRCKILLTEEKYFKRAQMSAPPPVVDLPRIIRHSPHVGSQSLTAPVLDARSLAYLLYTSGTTGKPKGVMIEHRGFINMSLDQIKGFGVSEADRVLQFASSSFDASLSEIFMALFSGAAVVVVGKDRIDDPERFTRYLDDKKVTNVTLPPVYLNALNGTGLRTVRTLITAGEAASGAEALFHSKTKAYFNAYGPTEISVCATYHKVDPGSPYPKSVPIGRPISNTAVYILDDALAPVPIGIPGEICIHGHGLARGYLNQPGLTAEKFVQVPFRKGARIYKTGDLGRWLPDGNIEFLGRRDTQVKVRGYRIEPGEIESRLTAHRDIRKAVVTARRHEGNTAELGAYIVAKRELKLSELKGYLAGFLPEYMIPAWFIPLEHIPLTPNGKIDNKALPDPAGALLLAGEKYEAPHNELQEQLAEIWEEVLGRKGIGIHDSFFDLGGNSLHAVQLASRVSGRLNLKVSAKGVFLNPTVADFSEALQTFHDRESAI